MKTSQKPVSKSRQQKPSERFDEFVETKPEPALSVEANIKNHGANGTASDKKDLTDNGVVDTLMGIFHDEYTMDKLLVTLRGLVPIVDHIKQTIEASSVSIPSVSTQLSSVTQATETATVTILDNLETLTASLTNAEEALAKVGEEDQRNQTADEQFGAALNTIVASRAGDAELADLLALWKQRDRGANTISHIESIRQGIAGAKGTLMQIAMALQVQDITSQQIAGVVHLIEDVRVKLAQTLFQVEHQTDHHENHHTHNKVDRGSFDMHATFSTSPDKQSNADEIIQQWTAQQAKK